MMTKYFLQRMVGDNESFFRYPTEPGASLVTTFTLSVSHLKIEDDPFVFFRFL